MLRTVDQLKAKRTQAAPRWGWIHFFVLVQFLLQILLLFPQFGAVRAIMRVASFGISLFLFSLVTASRYLSSSKKSRDRRFRYSESATVLSSLS